MLALPIFPGRLQPSIFGVGELNCRVRDGNGWTLTAINTNYFNWLSPIKTNYFIIQRSHYAVKNYLTVKVVTRAGIEPTFAA